jgi:F420-0:gamma-glutamyl ligase
MGVADELAAAASLMMGQAAEGTLLSMYAVPTARGSLQEPIVPKNKICFANA